MTELPTGSGLIVEFWAQAVDFCPMEIVAHRGAHESFPENSIPAFEEAVRLGADGIEFDVRLTKDGVPVVIHWLELSQAVGRSGYLFEVTFEELRKEALIGLESYQEDAAIPTLEEVLGRFAGRIDLEVELKGPEPESAQLVSDLLRSYESFWPRFEITSYEPALLRDVASKCPGLAVDLLSPRSEPWMTPEIVTHLALGRARMAGARAVHLHPTQLTESGLDSIRSAGFDVHCWDVNDEASLDLMKRFRIERIDTDRLKLALDFRTSPGPARAEPIGDEP